MRWAIVGVLFGCALCGRAQATEPAVRAVADMGITVSDMDRSLAFYESVLSFRRISDNEVSGADYEQLEGVFGARARIVGLQLGDERVTLTEYLAPRGRPVPADQRSNDRWFQHVAIVVRDMDEAYRWLRSHQVRQVSTEPERLPDWNRAAAGIKAFYFSDPDGHTLEVIWFPPGKGDPRWQKRSDRLFVGIDHTAIAAADTETSLRFYRDCLGMRVAGGSENWGTEQEHLNNVFGAHLRITTLRSANGPGIELLEYLSPRDGRPAPLDERANDLIHWQTTVVAPGAAACVRDAHRPLLVRDPDQHALILRD